jgi:hypothetical protein
MLPRLRFVVASLVIAVLPMVLLGAGLAPSAHPTSPAELSRADRPVVLGPAEYSETQYRLDRVALSYARRENELGKLRVRAAAPLANWIAAPAGTEPDSSAGTVATVTTDGPAVVTVNTTKPETSSEVTVSVTVSPAGKADKAEKEPEAPAQPSPASGKPAATAEPEASKPAPSKPEISATAPASDSISDAFRPAATAPAGQVFAALNPPKTETSALPQVHVVAPHAKPKPRARVVRRAKPVRTPPPAAQKPPPFFELFVWLFNIKPDTHGQVPAGSASQLQQQQQQQQQQ